jgi:hypothetical protein
VFGLTQCRDGPRLRTLSELRIEEREARLSNLAV